MTTKGAILRVIREHCLSCCNGSPKEVELCNVGNNPTSTIGRCQLYPFRLGKDPLPSKSRGFRKTQRVANEISKDSGGLIASHGRR